MVASNGSVKLYVIAVICILVVLTAVFIGLNPNLQQETPELPARDSSIPAGAAKMMPFERHNGLF